MIYLERDKPYVMLWPAIAVSLADEFWVGLTWLNFEIGWRSGDDGDKNDVHDVLARGQQ